MTPSYLLVITIMFISTIGTLFGYQGIVSGVPIEAEFGVPGGQCLRNRLMVFRVRGSGVWSTQGHLV